MIQQLTRCNPGGGILLALLAVICFAQPSKEYIRLGGRVIAIESPAAPPSGGGVYTLTPVTPTPWPLTAPGSVVRNVTIATLISGAHSVTLTCSSANPLLRCNSVSPTINGTVTASLTVLADSGIAPGVYQVTVTVNSSSGTGAQILDVSVNAPPSLSLALLGGLPQVLVLPGGSVSQQTLLTRSPSLENAEILCSSSNPAVVNTCPSSGLTSAQVNTTLIQTMANAPIGATTTITLKAKKDLVESPPVSFEIKLRAPGTTGPITLTPPGPLVMSPNGAQIIYADRAVNWTIQSGGGSLSGMLNSSANVTYQAPAAGGPTATVLRATDSSNAANFADLTIALSSVTVDLIVNGNTDVYAGQSRTFTANLSGAAAGTPVRWTVGGVVMQQGSSLTYTYTAPPAINGSSAVVIRAELPAYGNVGNSITLYLGTTAYRIVPNDPANNSTATVFTLAPNEFRTFYFVRNGGEVVTAQWTISSLCGTIFGVGVGVNQITSNALTYTAPNSACSPMTISAVRFGGTEAASATLTVQGAPGTAPVLLPANLQGSLAGSTSYWQKVQSFPMRLLSSSSQYGFSGMRTLFTKEMLSLEFPPAAGGPDSCYLWWNSLSGTDNSLTTTATPTSACLVSPSSLTGSFRPGPAGSISEFTATFNPYLAIGVPGIERVYGQSLGGLGLSSPWQFLGSFTVLPPIDVSVVSVPDFAPGRTDLLTLSVTANAGAPGGDYILQCPVLPAGISCPTPLPVVVIPSSASARSVTAVIPITVASNVTYGPNGTSYDLQVRAHSDIIVGGIDSALKTISIIVRPPVPAGAPPSIAVTAGAQSTAPVVRGNSVSYPVTISRTNFAGDVTVNCSSPASGVMCTPITFAAPGTTGPLNLIVNTTSSTPVSASHSLTITATGVGVLPASTTGVLNVNAAQGAAQSAVFDGTRTLAMDGFVGKPYLANLSQWRVETRIHGFKGSPTSLAVLSLGGYALNYRSYGHLVFTDYNEDPAQPGVYSCGLDMTNRPDDLIVRIERLLSGMRSIHFWDQSGNYYPADSCWDSSTNSPTQNPRNSSDQLGLFWNQPGRIGSNVWQDEKYVGKMAWLRIYGSAANGNAKPSETQNSTNLLYALEFEGNLSDLGLSGQPSIPPTVLGSAPTYVPSPGSSGASITLSAGAQSTAVVPGNSTQYPITITRTNVSGDVTVTCSSPAQGVSCPALTFPGPGTIGPLNLTVNTTSLTPVSASHPLTITATGTGVSPVAVSANLTVSAPPSITVSAGAQSPTPVVRGNSTQYPITIARTNFSGDVTVTCSSPAVGVGCPVLTFPGPGTTGPLNLIVNTTSLTPVSASHPLTITATGVGVSPASTPGVLNVTAAQGAAQSAVFDGTRTLAMDGFVGKPYLANLSPWRVETRIHGFKGSPTSLAVLSLGGYALNYRSYGHLVFTDYNEGATPGVYSCLLDMTNRPDDLIVRIERRTDGTRSVQFWDQSGNYYPADSCWDSSTNSPTQNPRNSNDQLGLFWNQPGRIGANVWQDEKYVGKMAWLRIYGSAANGNAKPSETQNSTNLLYALEFEGNLNDQGLVGQPSIPPTVLGSAPTYVPSP